MKQTSEEFMDFVVPKISSYLVALSNPVLDKGKADEVALNIASNTDWNNPSLMHKGLSYLAERYLENEGIFFVQ